MKMNELHFFRPFFVCMHVNDVECNEKSLVNACVKSENGMAMNVGNTRTSILHTWLDQYVTLKSLTNQNNTGSK